MFVRCFFIVCWDLFDFSGAKVQQTVELQMKIVLINCCFFSQIVNNAESA